MNHKNYIEQALRTESNLDSIDINTSELIMLLKSYISISENLDALKKKIFYKNDKKYLAKRLNYTNDALVELKKLLSAYELNDVNTKKSNLNPRIFHGLIGVLTESGEIASAFLKYLINPEALDKVNIQEEVIGDISWYTAILCDELNIDWEQGMKNNIEKLKVRYPEKFTESNAINRKLSEERKELENGSVQ